MVQTFIVTSGHFYGKLIQVIKDRLRNGQKFEKFRNSKFITTALKSILHLVKLQSLVVINVVKCEKYNPVKYANFVYFCITHRELIQLSRKWYQFFLRNTRKIPSLQTSQGYVFHILQHFTTKL